MPTFLLAMIMLVTGIRIISGHPIPAYGYEISKLDLQNEQGKEEKGEEAKKKFDSDNPYSTSIHNLIMFNSITNSPKTSYRSEAYSSFNDQPHTPPPNLGH
jgi:hypothetical protein